MYDGFCCGWYFLKWSLPAPTHGWYFGDSGLSLNLAPALGPTGWDPRPRQRKKRLLYVCCIVIHPLFLLFNSPPPALSCHKLIKCPYVPGQCVSNAWLSFPKTTLSPIPSIAVVPMLPAGRSGDTLSDAQPLALSGRTFPFLS